MSKAWGRPWLWYQRLFWLFLQSYWAPGRITPFWLVLKARDPSKSIELFYLSLGHSPGQIQLRWIVGIWGEWPNLVLICFGTKSLFLFCLRYHLQRLWSLQSSFRGNPWISARSLARLCCGVVYVKAIMGWPIHAKMKLQMEFCLVFWHLQVWNSPCTFGRTNSNPCVNYYSRGLETESWGAVLVVPMLKEPFGSGPTVGIKQTIPEPI